MEGTTIVLKKWRFEAKASRKRIYVLRKLEHGTVGDTIYFCNRNSAIMWIKIYGKHLGRYLLNCEMVTQCDGYVYFVKNGGRLGASAESKRTCAFATRNN